MTDASRTWEIVKASLLRAYNVDLLGPAFDVKRFFTKASIRAVDHSVFHRLSPIPAPPAP